MSLMETPMNTESLLNKIVQSGNATTLLCNMFENISPKEEYELRMTLRQLQASGYIDIKWADNKPYCVFVNNSARIYFEQITGREKNPCLHTTIIDNSITIGDRNKINRSHLFVRNNQVEFGETANKKAFVEKHPIIVSIIISLFTGIILMFSVWDSFVKWMEGIF